MNLHSPDWRTHPAHHVAVTRGDPWGPKMPVHETNIKISDLAESIFMYLFGNNPDEKHVISFNHCDGNIKRRYCAKSRIPFLYLLIWWPVVIAVRQCTIRLWKIMNLWQPHICCHHCTQLFYLNPHFKIIIFLSQVRWIAIVVTVPWSAGMQHAQMQGSYCKCLSV